MRQKRTRDERDSVIDIKHRRVEPPSDNDESYQTNHVEKVLNHVGITNPTQYRNADLLVVGAGGIGCELLKCLVLTGFQRITVLDMDRIDMSNLNRQFLFKDSDIGKYKSVVAAEAASKLNPDARVVALTGNVKDSPFGVDFFKQFDVVLNALDNADARGHVNRLCVANDTPLIEAGSTGYNGQVFAIKGGVTGCYDCYSKPIQRSYPVCTIRSTPDKPEHCVAWAKYLFDILFGRCSTTNILTDIKNGLFGNTTDNVVQKDPKAFSIQAFDYLYGSEIQKVASLVDSAEERSKPRPLWSNSIPHESDDSEQESTFLIKDQRIWSLKQCFEKFCSSIFFYFTERSQSIGEAVFDKNDCVAVDFVTAASNLRMYNYHIPRRSKWDVESIAGAIIPAVATTNAIVAASQVMQLLHLLQFTIDGPKTDVGKTDWSEFRQSKSRFVWIRQNCCDRSGLLLYPEPLEPPSSKCFVCQQRVMSLKLNCFKTWSIKRIVNEVFKWKMGANEPIVDLDGRACVYDPDELNDEVYQKVLEKSLFDRNVREGAIFTVTDSTQGRFQCDVIVHEDKSIDEKDFPELFILTTQYEGNSIKELVTDPKHSNSESEDSDDCIQCL